jgi:hypothetical protein
VFGLTVMIVVPCAAAVLLLKLETKSSPLEMAL